MLRALLVRILLGLKSDKCHDIYPIMRVKSPSWPWGARMETWRVSSDTCPLFIAPRETSPHIQLLALPI